MKGKDQMHIVGLAASRAARWHAGQFRKYDGLPYIIHPIGVMEIVSEYTKNQEVLAAALLHDVIEDCGIDRACLALNFNERIAGMVWELSDISKPSDGNRATRKQIDRDHSSKACPDSQTIKVADLIHNSISIIRYDRDFARVFMSEFKLLLEVLVKADPKIIIKAECVIAAYEKMIYQEILAKNQLSMPLDA